MDKKNIILDLFQSSNVTSIERCSCGIEGDVFIIKKDGKDYVVKFLSEKRTKKFPYCLENEIKTLEYLHQNNIDVPIIKSYSMIHNYLCYEYIPGIHLIPNEEDINILCLYLKRIYNCSVSGLSYLTQISQCKIRESLQDIAQIEREYNSILETELSQVKLYNKDFCVSHGNVHIENLVWLKQKQMLYLIDWDEVMLAPVEWDIASFFVDLSLKAETRLADHFLLSSRNLFKINEHTLLFFIHYIAYLCLVRVERNPSFLGIRNEDERIRHYSELLKSLIVL